MNYTLKEIISLAIAAERKTALDAKAEERVLHIVADEITSEIGKSQEEILKEVEKALDEMTIHSVKGFPTEGGLLPNTFYELGVIAASKTIAFEPAIEDGVKRFYEFSFETPSDITGIAITFANVQEWNGGNALQIEASKHYELSVDTDGYALFSSYDIAQDYLEFHALEDSTIAFEATTTSPTLYVSKTKGNFSLWDYSAITLNKGEVLYMYGSNATGTGDAAPNFFTMTGKIACKGNIMKLVALDHSNGLPSFTGGSFAYLFSDCAALVEAPELPLTTLEDGCYEEMFSGCTSLENAPELPATTLASGCYTNMFFGCTSLKYVKAMFTAFNEGDIDRWLNNVAAEGTFVKNSSAIWDEEDVVPEGWTVEEV